MKDTNRLERLVNKTVIYKQEHIKIKDWFAIPEEKAIRIITDGDNFTIAEADINDFCRKCLPIEEEESSTQALQVVNEVNGTITSLKDILMDNIKQVQANKDYIQQANTINNSVNSLLNMVTLQLKVTNAKKKFDQ